MNTERTNRVKNKATNPCPDTDHPCLKSDARIIVRLWGEIRPILPGLLRIDGISRFLPVMSEEEKEDSEDENREVSLGCGNRRVTGTLLYNR